MNWALAFIHIPPWLRLTFAAAVLIALAYAAFRVVGIEVP